MPRLNPFNNRYRNDGHIMRDAFRRCTADAFAPDPSIDRVLRTLETRTRSNPLDILLRGEEDARRELIDEGYEQPSGKMIRERLSDAFRVWG